jgi:diguanylate cyclase (GGDEF)-like protein/PAS domain S-box-containing protein
MVFMKVVAVRSDDQKPGTGLHETDGEVRGGRGGRTPFRWVSHLKGGQCMPVSVPLLNLFPEGTTQGEPAEEAGGSPATSNSATLNAVTLPGHRPALQLSAYEETVRALPEGVVVMDRAGRVLTINPSAERLLGVDRAEWLSVTDHRAGWSLTLPGGEPCAPEQWPLRLCLQDGQARSAVLGVRRPDGSQIWLSLKVLPLKRSGESRPYCAVAYFSEAYFSEWGLPPASSPAQAALPAAHLDALTHLNVRSHFMTQLELRLQAPTAPFALCCVELNHFRLVNSVFGHDIGDALLAGVAERLRLHMPRGTELTRYGDDEFMVLWPEIANTAAAEHCGRTLHALFDQPFRVGEREIRLAASVGISVYPHDGGAPGALLGRAENAAWQAKTSGRQGAEVSSALLGERLLEQWQLETELRLALNQEALQVVYQPLIDARSGETVAAEALVRWTHPILGEVSPARFIPVAEDAGLISQLGRLVLRQSCRDAARWPGTVRVTVNVSALQFERPDFLTLIAEVLAESGLEAGRLELELTESAVTRDPARAIADLQGLHALGVRVALDDFGTGYSSLAALRHLPISTLKMDRSFVADIETEPRQVPLVQAIVQLGHALNLEVVAEGIETAGQRALLTQLGCDLLQGYGIAMPSADPFGPGTADPPKKSKGPRV